MRGRRRLQLSWKNFVGSAGVPALPLLLSDAVATPVEFRAHYSEARSRAPPPRRLKV